MTQKTYFFAVTFQTMAFLCAGVSRYCLLFVHVKAEQPEVLDTGKEISYPANPTTAVVSFGSSPRRINIAVRSSHLHPVYEHQVQHRVPWDKCLAG